MSYQQWISVYIEHDYFEDRGCPPVRFRPTHDCEKHMRSAKQFFYPMGNGFRIFKDSDGDEAINEDMFFDIAVYSKDWLLGNYSNLDLDYRRGGAYYIGSSLPPIPGNNENNEKNDDKPMTLWCKEEQKTVEAVPILLKPKQFVISLEDAAPGDTYTLLDRKNNIVKERQAEDPGEISSGFYLYADVSGSDSGIYRLERNNRAIAWFYADDLLHRRKPAFIIGIDAASQHYKVRIAGRKADWQYHVIGRENGRKLNTLKIKNNNEKSLPGVSFERLRIDEQQKEAVFISNQPVPVLQKGFQSIELIENGNNGTPLVPHLPNADISSLHIKDGKWVAQIYVYI